MKFLSRIDLNLLTAFAAIESTGNITKAAKILGVSQPALSHTLRRLRDTIGDPLFAKSSQGMVKTPLAIRITQPIRDILERIQSEVLSTRPFDIARIERHFKIRSTDFLESLIMPSLLKRITTTAPDVQVSMMSAGFSLPKEELESGAIDLAIGGFFGNLPDGFYFKKILEDDFSCAVQKSHPRIGGKKAISLSTYCSESHLIIAPTGELNGTVDGALKKAKNRRKIIVGTSSFLVSGWILADSDCILTAPTKLIQQFCKYLPLTILKPPIEIPSIKIAQVWHGRNHHDPGHKWLREAISASVEITSSK